MNRKKTIYNQNYISLLDFLTHERKRLGLSQTDVARLLDMSQSEISKIETYERRLDVLEFKKLINAYRVKDNQKLKTLVINYLGLE